MSDTKVKSFAKIPNDFFYKNGEILNSIGGRDSFVLYCFLTSRKCMNDKIFVSLREIIRVLELEKSVQRSKERIINSLVLLNKEGYIEFEGNLEGTRNDESLVFQWIALFPKMGGKGWTFFYEDDFEIHRKISNTAYVVMWVLRMYTNFKTKTSFISITDMYSILQCNRNNIQNSIHLLELSGVFEVTRGDYYKHEAFENKIRPNSEYKYTGELDKLLNMSREDIKVILKPKIALKSDN